jgi:predicted MFS family arabinose efflux permease
MGPKNIVLIFAYKFIKIAVSATILGAGLSLVVGNLLSQVFFDGVWKVDFSYYLYLIVAVVLITFLLVLLNASGVYKKPIRSLLE